MHLKQVGPGVISLMSGLPIATLNGVFTDLAVDLPLLPARRLTPPRGRLSAKAALRR